MALVLQDRVRETSATTGTGTITLGGAFVGYRTFSSCVPTGSIVYYCIQNTTAGYEGEWEVGYGTYTTSGNTLSRDTVYSSSAGGTTKVAFSSPAALSVFITQPAESAAYLQTNGDLVIGDGVIQVSLGGAQGTTLANATFQAFGNVDGYIQNNIQNLSGGADASSDFVATNDIGDDTNFYVDVGINSSGFNSVDFPIYTPNSGYIFSTGNGTTTSDLFVGSADGDVILHAGGFTTAHVVGTASGTDQSMSFEADVNVGGALDVTGAAAFGSTVLLNQDPTLALQAATKQYVDQVSSSGLHIHEPVRVERGSNLTATYAQGGTTFNVTDISGGDTLTTSTTHGLSVNDQVWFTGTVGNGLSANVAYFVYSTPAGNQITLSTNFNGAQLTGLTNASGLTYPVRANSGEGATLTNSGAQAALVIDGVTVNTNDRVLVYGQTTAYQNGVYTVTNTGSGSTNWVLTRALDQDHYSPSDTNGMGEGDYFYVTSGATGAGESYVLTTTGEFIIGYDALTYTQFSGAVTYTGGTNIDVTGQTISLTGTVAATNGGTGANTVTTGDLLYGSAANTWSKLAAGGQYRVLVMGASTPEWNAITLNQANAVSGTLGATNGGTGQSTYTLGDLIYSNATNTLAKLPGQTTTSQKLLSQTGDGINSAAPTWTNSLDGFALANATVQNTSAVTLLDTSFTLQDNVDPTKQAKFNASGITTGTTVTYTLPAGAANVSTLLDTQTTQTITATKTFSGTFSAVNTVSLSTSATTQVTNIGGASQTGTLTVGQSTKAQTLNVGTGATETATTKTINIGTGGVSGSTTAINIGSANGTTVTLTGTVNGTVSNATYAVSSNSSTYTSNIIGGAAGSIPYQTALDTTGLLATGSGVLVGGTTPAWSTAPTLTGTNFSGIPNSATTASASNGASTIVARDISGGFAAGTITATFSGSGAALTNLNASNVASGTIPSAILGNSTVYIGTTAIALNRTTASQTLTGVSIDGNAGTATSTAAANLTGTTLAAGVTGSSLTSVGTLTSGTWSATTIAVNKGGTGVTTLTGLAYGNGTSAFSAATAAQVVAVIGSTAVANATYATSAGSANALNTANSYTGAGFTASSGTGKVILGTDAGGSIQLGRTDGVASTPYFDFNSGATAVDYDVRIQVSGGNGTSGNGTLAITAATTTSTGTITSNSDEKLKANWRPVQDDFVTKLADIKSGIYDRVDIDLTQAGVSAQSLQLVLPETVQKGDDGTLSVAYGNAALVAAVELAKEVVKLREELQALKAKTGA